MDKTSIYSQPMRNILENGFPEPADNPDQNSRPVILFLEKDGKEVPVIAVYCHNYMVQQWRMISYDGITLSYNELRMPHLIRRWIDIPSN